MKQEEPSGYSDQDLLDQAKKNKSTKIINAVIIGFMVGVIFYSILNNRVGLFTLIPLFIALKVFNDSRKNKVQN